MRINSNQSWENFWKAAEYYSFTPTKKEYINRNAVLGYLNDIWLTATPTDSTPSEERQLAISRCMGLKDAMDAVHEFPAADVVPVVHGRWLPTSDANKKRCSLCDVIHLIAQYPHGEINFCPNCGADMRKSNG